MNDSKKIFIKNLRNFMEKYDMKRPELASKINAPYQTVVSWFRGKGYPRIKYLDRLTKLFNVSKSELVDSHTSDSDTKDNSPSKRTLDIEKAIDNDEAVTFGGRPLSKLDKEMVKRILNNGDVKHHF